MSILFVGNTVADVGGAALNTTSTNERDVAYSPQGLIASIIANAGANTTTVEIPTAAVGDFWLHFRYRTPANWGSISADDGHVMRVYDTNGNNMVQWDVSNNNFFISCFGTGTFNGANFGLSANTTYTIDLKITFGANITADFYVNGGLVSSASGTNNGKTAPALVGIDNADITSSGGLDAYYSEFIATDGEPTLGWRLATLEPDTDGNYTGWTGGAAELGDNDTATRASGASDGDRQSWNPTAYAGPASPTGIRAVIGKAGAQRGVSGPQNMKQFLRIGATDYDGASVSPDGTTLGGVMEVWDNNPATAGAWATADLAALEMGLKAET